MLTYEYKFSGIERLYGPGSLEKLQKSHIAVIGIGGVGSWSAEALARSGVGKITLIDMDDICASNINRQLHATESSVGKVKVEEMKNRILSINPDCEVNAIFDFFTESTMQSLLDTKYDWIIDAFDSLSNKCLLINECKKRKLKVLSIGAAGGKIDPCQIQCADMSITRNDKLLQKVKKQLRQKYKFPRGDKKFQIPCVYSTELAQLPLEDCEVTEERRSLKLDCSAGLGAATHITGSFGFVAAAFVIRKITQ